MLYLNSRIVLLCVVSSTVLQVRDGLSAADCNGNGIDDASDLLPQNWGFLAEPSFHAGNNPFSLIAADLNGDGKPDVVTANDSGCVECIPATPAPGALSVYLNRGGGTFEDAVNYPVGSPVVAVSPVSVIATDLSDDGKLDLATSNVESNDVSVLLNQGDGTFKDAVNYPLADFGTGLLIAADLNGDGKPDLATLSGSYDASCGCYDGTVSVLLNRGDGTIKDAVNYPVGSPIVAWPASFIAADLNGDGKPDFATALCSANCESASVSILLNQGDGTFKDAGSYPVGMYPSRSSLIAADLNGDGTPDLAIANSGCEGCAPRISGNVSVLLNQGAGTFNSAVKYPVGDSPLALIASDFNGDGRPDLATANGDSADVSVLINQGDGTFRDTGSYPVGSGPMALIVADIDGDGTSDLVTANADCGRCRPQIPSHISVLFNQGDGTFRGAWSYPVVGSDSPQGSLIAADLNDDGKPDLAMGTVAYDVSVLLNQTTPSFSHDLNHNGVPDECETPFHRGDPNQSGTVDISDGITIFGFLFLGDPASLSCNESADANNDGKLDISDGIFLLSWLFAGGPEPAAPGPTGAPCGIDPDPLGSTGDLGCASYSGCR